jgi:hypothetical protein
MLIWLASYPRSGNTFFRALLYTVYGLPTVSIYNEIDEPLDQSIIGNAPIDKPTEDLSISKELYFRKTHGLADDNDELGIYLVRDGRDALVSYARYAVYEQENLTEQMKTEFYRTTLRQMIVTNDYFGGWSQNVESWVKRKAATTIVKFEELIVTPLPTLERAFIELALTIPNANETPPTFAALQAKMPKFFRRGKIGSWREEMPEDLQALFWEYHGTTMKSLGYDER